MTTLNGNNVAELNQFVEAVRRDPTRADRHPKLIAHWVGGSHARVECDGKVMYVGGDEELNAMRVLLAALAACDVDVVATYATLMGLEIETLSVEIGGHFNVCAYLGLPNAPGSGYDGLTYTIHARIPGATPRTVGRTASASGVWLTRHPFPRQTTCYARRGAGEPGCPARHRPHRPEMVEQGGSCFAQ